MKWSNGGLPSIRSSIELREKKLREGAEDIVRETVHEAEIEQRRIIETAVTETGRRRVATGGRSSAHGSISPGRIDSGLMINSTGTSATADGGEVVGRWGWFDPEEYFEIQEWGSDRIQAMHSLFLSWIRARGRLAKRINKLVRTGSAGS